MMAPGASPTVNQETQSPSSICPTDSTSVFPVGLGPGFAPRDTDPAQPAPVACHWVKLIDGSQVNLSTLSIPQLEALQWQQEPAFAKRIVESTRGSETRQATIRWAYETVCAILQELASRHRSNTTLSMGMDPRYVSLVLDTLNSFRSASHTPHFFELGFGSGILLDAVVQAGFAVGGLEVVEPLFEQTRSKLGDANSHHLALGNFLDLDPSLHAGRYDVVYWNDVMEHIPTDEIQDYLQQLHRLLRPGGKLITITPNWHMRPSDITATYFPARTQAVGFHLKEYTLREINTLLRQAGFSHLETPTWISPNRIYTSRLHATHLKQYLEPTLEWLPFPVAVQICRRLGFNCTIATRDSK